MRPVTFYLITAVLVITDQMSKWSVSRSAPPSGRSIIPGVFSLMPTHNAEGAFNIVQAPGWVFVIVAVVAILALVVAYHMGQRDDTVLCGALALALGGAIGNLIDRAMYGYVRDFFQIHDFSGRTLWPIFNIADAGITVAIILIAYRAIWPKANPAPSAQPPQA